MQSKRFLLFLMGLVFALVSAGCAQAPATNRDLNAEAMDQMTHWGNSPP